MKKKNRLQDEIKFYREITALLGIDFKFFSEHHAIKTHIYTIYTILGFVDYLLILTLSIN